MTAALIPEGEPLGVWDVTHGVPIVIYDDLSGWPPRRELLQMAEWVRTRMPGYAHDSYRIEFYLLDIPFAVTYCYRRNDAGWKYQDPATGTAATEPPVVVPLDELPPAHLLRQP